MIKFIDILENMSSFDEDTFKINKFKDTFKIEGIPIYYGFEPNPLNPKSESEITSIFNSIKKNQQVDDTFKKLINTTAPSNALYDKIITIKSSSDLNKHISDILSRKYNIPIVKNISTSKVKYLPKDMINKERYDKADPTTKRMVDTFIKCLEKNFPGEELEIKKSGYEGSCGLQSGARNILNPVYKIDGNVSPYDRILIVDDFTVSGSSMKEVFKVLMASGISRKNITGYVLGIKR